MQKAILKISSVLLCGLLIYNSLGYFLTLSTIRMAMRHQHWALLSSLPEEQLSIFVFEKNATDSRLRIMDEREILVDGKLYDVVRKIDNGRQIKYFCVWDREEETLISKTRLFNSQAQQMPVQDKSRQIVEKIIKTGILNANTTFILENYIFPLLIFDIVTYSDPEIQISLPPPQSLC